MHFLLVSDWRTIPFDRETLAHWNFDSHRRIRCLDNRYPTLDSFCCNSKQSHCHFWSLSSNTTNQTTEVTQCTSGLTTFLCSTICLERARKFYHDTKRPLSYCTFAECSLCHRSPVGCPRIHVPVDCHRPNSKIPLSARHLFFNPKKKIACSPSFFPIQYPSTCPWKPNVRMINELQGHDVFPSILGKSKCHTSQTPTADYGHHTRSISVNSVRDKAKFEAHFHSFFFFVTVYFIHQMKIWNEWLMMTARTIFAL